MANPSPLAQRFDDADAQFVGFGEGMAVVALHDVLEVEYAAMRKAAGLTDDAHRALITLTGGDRLDFLHRLLTCDTASLKPGQVRRGFLLTAKGRIIADMFVVHTDDATHLDTDVFAAPALYEQLDQLLFGEDVVIDNRTDSWHRLSLHGLKASAVVDAGHAATHEPLENMTADTTQVGPIGIAAFRADECGVPGVHLWTHAGHAPPLWQALSEAGESLGLRPAGWMAYNTARIEAGSPLFMVDFNSDSLPGETGLLEQTVCFTKGCYRGQEIVARLKDVGHPSKTLVGFAGADDVLPVAGTPVFDKPNGDQVGTVTSSTLAPMRGGRAIGLAMVNWDRREPGTQLHTPAEGTTIMIEIEPLGGPGE